MGGKWETDLLLSTFQTILKKLQYFKLLHFNLLIVTESTDRSKQQVIVYKIKPIASCICKDGFPECSATLSVCESG